MQEKTAIVLVVDGISAQHLGTYGNTAFDTPNIDRLAVGAELFEHCYCCNVDAQQAFEDLVTRQRHRIGPVRPDAADANQHAEENLVEAWSNDTIETIFITDDDRFIAHPVVDSFDKVVDVRPEIDAAKTVRAADAIEETSLALTVSQIVHYIQSVERPAFVWIQLKGLLANWDAPYAMRAKLALDDDPDPPSFVEPPSLSWEGEVDPDDQLGIQQAFSAQLSLFDLCLGVLLDAIDLENQEDLLFCLTALRGYPLGEHYRVGGAEEVLHGEATHVPLVVNRTDLRPTTIRHQHLTIAGQFMDMVDRWFCEMGSTVDPLFDEGPKLIVMESVNSYSIRTPAWQLIEIEQKCQLFAKPDDRWEINDVADRCANVVVMLQEIADIVRQKQNSDGIVLPELLVDQFR